jgi:hypothetical protein
MSIISRAAVRLVICAVAIVGYSYYQQRIGETRATAAYRQAIQEQKLEAGTALARETGKTRAAEQTLQAFKNQQEIDDAKNKRVVGALADQLRAAAAGAAGRLRDPNASPAGCGRGGGSAKGADPARAGGGAANVAQTGGLFSKEASGLFQQLTREADEVNVAYISCRADSFTVREVLK